MNRNKMIAWAASIVTITLTAGWLAGCEEITQVDNAILISPNPAAITATNGTAVLQAIVQHGWAQQPDGRETIATNQPLYLPLVWTVSNPELGSIRVSGAFTAIYQRNGARVGNNYVTVRDQVRAEGVAVVNQTIAESVAVAPPETNAVVVIP